MESEMLFILLLALVVLGPRRLPEIGRQIGRLLAEFRRAKNEFTSQIQDEIHQIEEDERKTRQPSSPSQQLPAAPLENAPENRILPPTAAPAGTVNIKSSAQSPASEPGYEEAVQGTNG